MPGGIKGITVKIGGDTTELGRSLKEVSSQTRSLQSELRGVNSLLKFDSKNVTLLKQKQDLLKKSIEETENKQKTLNEVLRKVDSGEIEMTEEEYRNLQREIALTEGTLKQLNKQMEEFGSAGAQKIAQVGESMKTTGEKIEGAGKKLLPVTGAIAGVGAIAIKTTSDFDSSMSNVSAISGATGDDLQKLRDKAREMGAQTKFSASESADAMSYMAMAGWKTDEMLNGISGVMSLAAASGEDLAKTSDILTDGLTAFGLKAEESGRMADVMASASSNANTNVSLLGESYKYCASTAGAMGFSLEDVTESLGLMANAGVKGSQAGTTLKNAMINLAKPTDAMAGVMEKYGISLTNTDGSMKSWNEIVGDLRNSLGGLSEAEQTSAVATLFGKEATAGMLAVINAAPEDVEKLNTAINNSTGSAEKMADTMNNNLAGKITILKSQLQELAISFGDVLMPVINKIVTSVQGFVDKLNGMSDGQKKIVLVISGIVASVGPLLIIIGKLCSSIGSVLMLAPKLISGFKMIKAAFASFGAVLSANPIGIIITAIGALIAILVALYKHNDKFKAFVDGIVAKINEFVKLIPNKMEALKDNVLNKFNEIKIKIKSTMDGLKNIFNTAFEIIKNIFTKYTNSWKSIITNVLNAIKTFITSIINSWKNIISNGLNVIKNVINTVWNAIKSNTSAVWNNIKSGISSVVNSIKSNVSNVWNAIKNTTTAVWNGIKSAIVTPINNAKEAFTSAIQKMKNALHFKWKLPALKLPHISVSGGVAPFGIGGKGSLPKFNIKWYKDGAIFKKPTLFNTPYGMKGVGEAGAEVVSPLSDLTSYVNEAVNNGEVIERLNEIETVASKYLPLLARRLAIVLDSGTLIGETIDIIDSKLADNRQLKERGC